MRQKEIMIHTEQFQDLVQMPRMRLKENILWIFFGKYNPVKTDTLHELQ